jgi:integrase
MKLNRINPKQLSATALATTTARLNDGGGLALLPNYKGNAGQHRWVFRSTLQGKAFEMGFGTLAEVTLAAARDKAIEARQKVGKGEDPRAERKSQRADETQAIENARRIAEGLPVENSVKDWVLRYVDKQRSSWATTETEEGWIGTPKQLARGEYGGQMGKYVFPIIGDKNIRDIEQQEITALLTASQKEAAKAGGNGSETMHRLRKKLVSVFDFAMYNKYINRNECVGQEKVIPKKRGSNHPAVKTAEALRAVLACFETYSGSLVTRTAMQVQVYLFQRSNITVGMQWAHVDLVRGLWTVPCALMKADQEEKDTGVDHEVHLPRQVVKLLEVLRETTGGGKYVFPHEDDVNRPMPVDTLNDAMQRAMGQRKGTPWTSYQVAHGFRAVAITFGPKHVELYGAPLVKDVLDVIAGHKVGDYLGESYMRDDFGDRRARYMQAYADWIDAIRAGEFWAIQTVTERKAAEWEARAAANAPTIDPAQWQRFLAFQAAEAAQQAQKAA